MKRLFLAVIAALMLSSTFLQTVSAHVFIKDNTGSIGAILHVAPDDDPIAGEPSTLYVDIQSQAFSQHQHNFSLSITDERGQEMKVPVTLTGSTAIATYTFPEQGAYRLVLAASSKTVDNKHVHTFTHSQRVSRGVSASALSKPSYAWAEMSLIGCLILFALLVIMFINRRDAIAKQSKW